MARRDELMAAMRPNGGTTAPAKGRRRRELQEQVAGRRPGKRLGQFKPERQPQSLGQVAMLAQRLQGGQPGVRPMPLLTGGPQAKVSGAVQPALGHQLSRRVASGQIDQAQAQRTAKERGELKSAYGPDWRQQVFGEDVQALRQGLAGAQKGNPRYEAAQKAVMAARKKALERARAKASGSAIGSSAEGRKYL